MQNHRKTITLAGRSVLLGVPQSLMLRHDIVAAAAQNAERAAFAALGICWAGETTPEKDAEGKDRPALPESEKRKAAEPGTPPWPGRVKARIDKFRYDALSFGGAVYDELAGTLGIDPDLLWDAAGAAFALVLEAYNESAMSAGEAVEEAARFSAAPVPPT